MEEDKRKIFRDLYKYKSTEQLKWLLMANYRGLWKTDEECIAAIDQILGEKQSKARKKAWGTEKEMLLWSARIKTFLFVAGALILFFIMIPLLKRKDYVYRISTCMSACLYWFHYIILRQKWYIQNTIKRLMYYYRNVMILNG